MADKVKCAACGRLTVPGAFCEKCGQDPGADNTSEPLAKPGPEAIKLDIPPMRTEIENPEPSVDREPTVVINRAPAVRRSVESDATTSPPPAPSPTPTPVAPKPVVKPVESGCLDLRVECNIAQFFIEGISSPFTFRVTPLVDGLEDIHIYLESDAGSGVSADRRIRKRLTRDRSFIQRFNLQIDHLFGVVAFDVFITYSKEGKDYTFENATTHKVYPADSNAREVVETIIVNINNEINAGHAADATVNNGLEQLQDLRNQTSASDKACTLIDKIEGLPHAFSALALYPSNWEPPDGFFSAGRLFAKRAVESAPADAQFTKLSLKVDGSSYHLVVGDAVALGRERQNDIVLRLFNRAGVAERDLNGRLSRFHCRIELHGEHCFVKDGGFSPSDGTTKESGQGTFVNGKRLAPMESIELVSDMNSCVGLAGADERIFGAAIIDVHPVRCRQEVDSCRMAADCEANMISCLRITRRDEAPEAYVMLVRCADLGAIAPGLAGLRVWQQGGGIMFSALGQKDWLRPGKTIDTGRKKVRCEQWGQWGL